MVGVSKSLNCVRLSLQEFLSSKVKYKILLTWVLIGKVERFRNIEKYKKVTIVKILGLPIWSKGKIVLVLSTVFSLKNKFQRVDLQIHG